MRDFTPAYSDCVPLDYMVFKAQKNTRTPYGATQSRSGGIENRAGGAISRVPQPVTMCQGVLSIGVVRENPVGVSISVINTGGLYTLCKGQGGGYACKSEVILSNIVGTSRGGGVQDGYIPTPRNFSPHRLFRTAVE